MRNANWALIGFQLVVTERKISQSEAQTQLFKSFSKSLFATKFPIQNAQSSSNSQEKLPMHPPKKKTKNRLNTKLIKLSLMFPYIFFQQHKFFPEKQFTNILCFYAVI
jgi:hypothetical protein